MEYKVDARLAFLEDDYEEARLSSRWKVEQDKLRENFPAAKLFSRTGDDGIGMVSFEIDTGVSTRKVRIEIPDGYPHDFPRVFPDGWAPEEATDSSEFNHIWGDGRLCVQDETQWSRDGSIALVIARACKWANKYETWLQSGPSGDRTWPGAQH